MTVLLLPLVFLARLRIANMRKLLLIALFFISQQSFATTYYLDTSCTFNGDGTGASGTCAASGGAAGAYNTGASITFGAGDTIFIKRGTTVTNFPSPVSKNITIDDYGSATACPVISKSSTFALSLSAANVTINDICLTGVNTSAVLNISAATASLNRIEVYGNTSAGAILVRFNTGSEGSSITDSYIHNSADDGIGVGSGVTGLITITNLRCSNVDTDNLTGDCIQAYTGTSATLVINGGKFYKETANKQALIYDGSGYLVVKGTPTFDVRGGSQGIQTAGTGSAFIYGATIIGGSASAKLIQVTNTGTTYINNVTGTGGVYGIYVSHASGSAEVVNSTIRGQSNSAIYNTTGGSLKVTQTHMGAPVSLYNASGSASLVSDYNTFAVPGFVWNGSVVNGLTTWQSTSSQDTNSIVAQSFVAKRTARN